MPPSEIAAELFSKWYEYCLEHGIEPEQVVEDFGEMLLITNSETIEEVKKLLNAG